MDGKQKKPSKPRRKIDRVEWRGTKFASAFERDFAKYLTKNKIVWEYEPDTFKWYPTARTYKPDFKVYNTDGTFFYLETKGYFDGPSRAKMAAIKQQHPDVDIRIVFMDPKKKISSKTKAPRTYGDWADRTGYKWSSFALPKEWRATCTRKKKDAVE